MNFVLSSLFPCPWLYTSYNSMQKGVLINCTLASFIRKISINYGQDRILGGPVTNLSSRPTYIIYISPVKGLSTSSKEVGGAKRETREVEETRLLKLNDFLFTSHLDNVNFFKVLRYCKRSQISKKVV